jgi:hypothetical protein
MPAADEQSAARYGVDHQDFFLLARNFIEPFTGSHVKRLRTSFSFVFGNDAVHLLHVSGCRIIFEKGCITNR